ncbi:ficolin-2-like [Dendronephthya gigantea]|uniref:ficolin-2-like n=1 Tax=Dendronephthya gigantea TaxID=151771 RepID=UPI00106A389A|nr:ficolin-2-like [Dendronephthya gigantea]
MFHISVLLIVKVAFIAAQNCSHRIYNIITTGGSSLHPDEIISSHTVNSGIVPIECYELCQKEPKCVGYNYRETINVVNCQLTKFTEKKNDIVMTGEWMLMLDEKAPKYYKEEQRKNDSVKSVTCILIDTGSSCSNLYNKGVRTDGVYTIDPDGQGSFQVSCDMSTDGGGWTVFQRRQDGSQNFFLGWSDYKTGFGNLSGEFWLGLDKIHRLTKSGQNVLRVDLMDFKSTESFAKFETFNVTDESDKYRLTIGNYSGDAGDSLDVHNQMQFSTKDSDNDVSGNNNNCAMNYEGAWWYENCYHSNLNGKYLGADDDSGSGIKWLSWNVYSMQKAEMKIRPNPL